MNRTTRVWPTGIAICILGACAALADIADAPAAEFDYEAFVVAVDQASRKLGAIRDEIDQSRFDADEWLGVLDYEAAEVLQAVSSEIVFQPYDGVLRGVDGTLRARAGNSADQALLLAYLLKSAGYDARIARGDLSKVDARRLLATLRGPEYRESLGYLKDVAEAQLGAEAVRDRRSINLAETVLARRADRVSDLIMTTLQEAGVDLAPRDVTDKLVDEVTGYFWVQHRDGPGDQWQDAHPAFANMPPPRTSPLEFFAAQLPDRYLHRLTISAWIVQKLGDERTTHRIMNDFSHPVANLNGTAIRFRNHPNGLTSSTLEDLDTAVQQTQILVPMLNGAVAPGAKAFDLNGQRVDPLALQSAATGLFSTLSDKMESAGESVAERELMALESMWIEFVFTSPDGSATRSRRYLIAPGSQFETDRDRLWPLITDHTYLVNTGHDPLDYLADRYLATGIASGDYLKALTHKLLFPEAGTALPTADIPMDFGPLTQYRLMEARPGAIETPLPTRPKLLGFRHGYVDADTAFFGVDVVANAGRQVRAVDGRILQNVRAAIRQGVWDTSVEQVPPRSVHKQAQANAIDILSAAVDQDIDLNVISAGDTSAVEELSLPATVSTLLREELGAGYTVIVPARKPEGQAMSGWWRVKPDTGETLGVTADGYGAEYVEYLVDMVETGLGLVNAVKGLKKCEEQPSMDTKLCCLMETHINNVGGVAFGGILGDLAGGAGGYVFLAVKTTVNQTLQVPQADANCEQLPQTEW